MALETVVGIVTVQKGFATEEGITVEGPVWMPGGRVRDGLFAKDYDFAFMSPALISLARERGMPFKAVFPLYERQYFGLFASNNLSDEEKKRTVSDLKGWLKGKRIGNSGPGTGSWAFAAFIYKKLGLDPLKDMDLIVVGMDPRIHLGALKTGKADAISIWEPIISLGETEGLLFPIVDTRDPGTHKKFFGEAALQMMLATREDVIREPLTRTETELRLDRAAMRVSRRITRGRRSRKVDKQGIVRHSCTGKVTKEVSSGPFAH